MDVDEAGRHDLAAPVNHPGRVRMAGGDGIGRPDIGDALGLDEDSARIVDGAVSVDGQYGRVFYEDAHGMPPPSPGSETTILRMARGSNKRPKPMAGARPRPS
jgi:hypothetical protein